MGLFDTSQSDAEIASLKWEIPTPPSLADTIDIQLNAETTGLRWWDGDRVIGMSLRVPGGQKWYLPCGHRGGGNLDEEALRRWAKTELRNKRITNINTRFDIHQLREWGVDLEEQGCQVSDVAHYAALLNEHRKRFSLDLLAEDYLGGPTVARLDESRMVDYHPAQVAPRSMHNVELVWQLREVFWPQLEAEDLQRVRQLEDECIFATCEMEKNGAKIDLELLDRWLRRSETELHQLLYDIGKSVGRHTQEMLFDGGKAPDFINVDSSKDMEELFRKLKLPISRTESGRPSFTANILKSIDHPVIKQVFRASRIIDLRNKYLIPYDKSVNKSTGILRYALHQLRVQKDPYDDSYAGTISGRYSSTKIDNKNDEGINVQQVVKPAKTRVAFGFNEDDDSHDEEIYIIRQLYIPQDNQDFLSTDAMQIEYRLFASETNSPRLLKIYQDDPKASYHKMIHGLLKQYKPDLPYRRAKDVNFAVQYGAGVRKMALMLGFISEQEYTELLHDPSWKSEPKLREVFEIQRIYDKAVPEVRPMVKKAAELAETRGYIKSILGRRSRFKDGARSHKALNTRIQPSAADIMKQKIVEVHKARKQTGCTLRFTVHDELNMDCPNKESAKLVDQILNRQSFKLNVPILWDTSLGPNWKDGEPING